MSNATGGLVIDWTQMPTYNTIMSVSAGAALMSIVQFVRTLLQRKETDVGAWAVVFAVPGAILTITGVHMSLTWPFAKYFPYDNIIFGETSFGFGVLLLAAAFFLWKRQSTIAAEADPVAYLARAAQPVAIFVVGMGLSLIAIGFAGVVFQLFAAPPEEPISGLAAPYPWLEASVISAMFGSVGIGAVLFPVAAAGFSRTRATTPVQKIIGWFWTLDGLGFLLFGALNFFTHIGLIINTSPHS